MQIISHIESQEYLLKLNMNNTSTDRQTVGEVRRYLLSENYYLWLIMLGRQMYGVG